MRCAAAAGRSLRQTMLLRAWPVLKCLPFRRSSSVPWRRGAGARLSASAGPVRTLTLTLTLLCVWRAQLTEMPKRFLQNQATRMGLGSAGLKAELVNRLETHLVDQLGPQGLLTLGPGEEPAAAEAETPQMPRAPLRGPQEPRVAVAVVAGASAGALDGARTLITHLHTAPRAGSAGAAVVDCE